MSQKLSRRVFTAVKSDVLITSQCRYYKFNEVDISAAKTNVRLTSKTLIALVNKYDEFKQAGMIIWLLGYYSFILDKNLDVRKHFKLIEEVQHIYTSPINLNPNDVQIRQIRESLERTANRLSEQVNFWTDMYRNLNRRNGS